MRVEYETVKPKKRRTRRRMVLSVLEVVLLVVFVVAFYNVAKTLYDYKKGDDTYNDARATAVEQIMEVSPDAMQLDPHIGEPDIKVDLTKLQEENKDIFGWIYIPKTKINYPLLAPGDDDKYLRHTYKMEYNILGSIFVSQDCGTDFLHQAHSLIYGHNTQNGSMFGDLKEYKKRAYYDEHPIFYILTKDRIYKYRIFSAFTAETSSKVYQMTFPTNANFSSWLEDMSKKSETDFGVPIIALGDASERIMTLSTCTSRTRTERFVVNGILIDNWAPVV